MLSQIKGSAKILYFATVAMSVVLSCNSKQENVVSQLVTKKMHDGSTKIIGATINGKKEGLWIEYDDSGRLSSQKIFFHDSLSGEVVSYHDDGKTILSKGVLENGKEEGEWVIYYDSDKVAEKGRYKNGNKIGVWEYYIENGKLNKKIEYTDTGKKVILDNHLLPPVPAPGAIPITDSNNRVYVQ